MALGGFNPLGAVGGTAIGVGVGSAIAGGISPLVQDLVNLAWETHPERPLSASLAAQLVAEGLLAGDDGAAEAARTGFDSTRFARMVEAARDGPSVGNAVELLRRGVFDAGDFARALRQAGMRPEWDPFLTRLTAHVISVDELANMVVRGHLALADGAQRAEAVGVTPAQFELYVANTGNPPGNDEALDLWNRGVLDEADVDRALAQSNLKPEWFEAFKERRYFIPTVADLVRFAVREVFTPAIRAQYGLDDEFPSDFEREGLKRGLSPEWARAYWAAHWELPSIEQGYRMLHRSVIDAGELDVLLRTKDVMPYWRERLTEIAYLVPGRVDLRRMFRADVIDEAAVERGYLDLGYAPDAARTLTDFAVDEKENAAAGGNLPARYRRSLIARLYRLYLMQDATEAQARDLMGRVGIRAQTIDDVLELWTLERSIVRAELTPAQIKSAWKKGRLTEAEALAELDERGYSQTDATDFLNS